MKKLLLSLSAIAGMAIVMFFTGCGEKDIDPPKDMCPNKEGIQLSASECTEPPVPVPTGTVVANKTSIGYKETVTFTYSFINADQGVYISGVLMGGQSGNYTTGVLSKDSVFTIIAKGKGGTTTNPSITISVAPDPRIAFITTGTFKDAGMITRKLTDTNWTFWASAFDGLIDNFVFSYQGFTNLPGNTCMVTKQNGSLSESKWFFKNETGFYLAGFDYDDFVITGEKSFKIHKFDEVAGHPGEYWIFFQK